MKKLNLIIRGYVSSDSRSSRSNPDVKFSLNFLEIKTGYEHLINRLSKSADVDTYFSTYEPLSKNIQKQLISIPTVKGFCFSRPEGSTQFTTVENAILNLPKNNSLFIRSDLLIKEDLVKIICNVDFNNFNRIHLISLESEPHESMNYGDNCIDVMQLVPKKRLNTFLKYIRKPDRLEKNGSNFEDFIKNQDVLHESPRDFSFGCHHAHDLHKYTPCIFLTDDTCCGSTYTCEKYFTIYRG